MEEIDIKDWDEDDLPQEKHGCPFRQEIIEDFDYTCTCSVNQEHECRMGI